MKKTDDDGVLKKYHCFYCGNDFERIVRSGGERHNAWSSMVQCEKCKNFLKT